MKTGILGGTFNPIHNSHLYIALEYKRILSLDKVLIIPTFDPPHKEANNLADACHRLEMCRLAVKDLAGFEVYDYEIQMQEKSYSYKTLEHLRKKYPQDEMFFIMGTDMFFTVQNWYKTEIIYANATLCAAARGENELLAMQKQKAFLEQQGAKCIVTSIAPRPLSSTEIREATANAEDTYDMVPPVVAEYIKEHGLYSSMG